MASIWSTQEQKSYVTNYKFFMWRL